MGLLGGDARVGKGPAATSGQGKNSLDISLVNLQFYLKVERYSRTCLRAKYF